MTVQKTIQALFVAWQQPTSRRYYPIARLVAGIGDNHELFEFSYIRGAHEAAKDGFQPLLAFPNMHGVYRSAQLFPFFTNRLMARNRPDFRNYVDRLGLEPDADAMLILARSGGTRATDSIEMFPLPIFDDMVGNYQTCFWMHGFRHLEPAAQATVLALAPGEELIAEPEPANPKDPHAVRLFTTQGIPAGYVPRYLSSDAVHLLTNCMTFRVFAERVNPEPAPVQHRLLCRLESCWPDGFVPCNQDVYHPISAEAVHLDPCHVPDTLP